MKTFLKLLPFGAYTNDRIKEIKEEILKREKLVKVKKISITAIDKAYFKQKGEKSMKTTESKAHKKLYPKKLKLKNLMHKLNKRKK